MIDPMIEISAINEAHNPNEIKYGRIGVKTMLITKVLNHTHLTAVFMTRISCIKCHRRQLILHKIALK